MVNARLTDPVFYASALFAREQFSNRAIRAFYANETAYGDALEELAHLVGLVETELEFGQVGPTVVVLPNEY